MVSNETEKYLKRVLKKRLSVTVATVVTFLITGTVGYANPTFGQSYFHANYDGNKSYENWGDNDEKKQATGENSLAGGVGAKAIGKNTTALGNYSSAAGDNSMSIGNISYSATDSTAVGEQADAKGTKSIAVGTGSKTKLETVGGVAIGYNANSGDGGAIAIGESVEATGENAISIGKGSKAKGEEKTKVYLDEEILTKLNDKNSSLEIKTDDKGNKYIEIEYKDEQGTKYTPKAAFALAIGSGATATNDGAAAFGYQANATGKRSAAFGNNTSAMGDASMAIGIGSASSGASSMAVGNRALALGGNSAAFGHEVSAYGDNSVAFGIGSVSSGASSIAIGNKALTQKDASDSLVIGHNSVVNGSKSIAIGNKTYAGGKAVTYVPVGGHLEEQIANGNLLGDKDQKFYVWNGETYEEFNPATDKEKEKYIKVNNKNIEKIDHTLAIGYYSEALNKGASAFGYESTALGEQSSSLGYGTTASGKQSMAIGISNLAGGERSIAIGNEAITFKDAIDSLVIGNTARAEKAKGMALGAYSVSEGEQSTAVGPSAEALGDSSLALGDTAKGYTNNAIAIGSSSEAGRSDKANSNNAIAIGNLAKSYGIASTALGSGAKAEGWYSNAIGNTATATGHYSTAVGTAANSQGYGSASIGWSSSATGENSTAIGNSANSQGKGAASIGSNSGAAGEYSVAIGGGANVGYDKAASATGLWGVALGHKANAEGSQSTAIANGAQATAGNALAIGTDSKATFANTTAIGVGANASHEDAIAIGAWSSTKEATEVSEAKIGNVTYGGFAGTTPKSVISIGKAGIERQIINVAAGRITKDSTDAINGSQLYAVANKPISFTGDSGKTDRKLGETLKIVGDGVVSTAATEGQIKLTIDKDKLKYIGSKNISIGANNKIETKEAVQFNNSVTVGSSTGDNVEIQNNSVTVGNSGKQNVKIGKDSIQFTKEIGAPGGLGASTYSPGLKISLEGIDMDDAEIKNVKSAIQSQNPAKFLDKLKAAQKDKATAKNAVNVSDLNSVSLELAGDISTNAKDIAGNKINIETNAGNITKLTNLSNITPAGENVIKKNAKAAIEVKGVGLASVNKKDVNGVDTYTVTVASDSTKADIDLGNISAAGITKIKTTAQEAIKVGAGTNTKVDTETDTNGNKTYKINVAGNGTIASGDTGLISGGTLYTETRIANNGSYIQAGKSAAENLKLLDTQVSSNTTGISDNKDAINKFGTVVTKANSGLVISSDNKALKNGDVELDLNIVPVVDKFVNNTTAVGKVIDKVENEADLAYKANASGTARETKLKKGLVFTDGSMTTATTGEGGVVTFDLNADTKTKIGNIAKNRTSIDKNIGDIANISNRLDGKAYGVTAGGKNAVRKIGETLAVTAGNNIITAIDGDDEKSAALKISLNSKIDLGNDGTITIGGTTFKDKELKMGNTIINDKGITTDSIHIGGNTYIDKQGINANNQVIKNVADGANNNDAVNKKQLDEVAAKINSTTITGSDNVKVTTKLGKPHDYIITVKGEGTIAQNDNKIVTGQTMYNELRPNDGTYIKKNDTTATNLKNLDDQMKKNFDNISTNTGNIAANKTAISDVKTNLESATFGVTAGDKTATRKLNNTLEVKGENNITASIKGTEEGKSNLVIALNKDVDLTDAGTFKIGNVSGKNNEFKVGNSIIRNEGITADKIDVGSIHKAEITDGKIVLGENNKGSEHLIFDGTGKEYGKVGIGFVNSKNEVGTYITDDYARFGGVEIGHANDGDHVDGLSNIKWTIDHTKLNQKPAEFKSGRAATEDQLWIVSKEFNNRLLNVSDWRLVGEKNNSITGTTHENMLEKYSKDNAYTVDNEKIVLNVMDVNPDGKHTVQNITINDVASAKKVDELDKFNVKFATKNESGKDVVDYSQINLPGVEVSGKNIGTKITNLANGTDDSDAVNLGQLKSSVVRISVNDGKMAPKDENNKPNGKYSSGGNLLIKKSLEDNGANGANFDIKLNDVVNIGSDADEFKKAKMVTIDGTKAQISVGKNTFIENNKATIGGIKIAGVESKWVQDPNGTDFNPNRPKEKGKWVDTGNKNTITGLENVAWSGTTTDKSRAATEGQLQSLTEKGFALEAEGPGGTATDGVTPNKELRGKLGSALKVHGDNKNISTTIDGGALKIKMSEAPEFKTLTVTNGVNGIAINGVNKVITGLSNQTLDSGYGENARAGQAATEAQLKLVNDVAKVHNTVVKGDNITVDNSTNANGGIEYKISAANMRVIKGEIAYDPYVVPGGGTTKSAVAHYGAKGKLTLTLGDNTTIDIPNLRDRYTVNGNFKAGAATAEGEKNKDVITFTRNDGSTYDVVLGELAEAGSLVNTYVTKNEMNNEVSTIKNSMNNLGFNLSADSLNGADGPKIVDGTKVLITGKKVATGDGHGNISTTIAEENGKQVLHINQVNNPKFSYKLKDVAEEQIVEINAKYQKKVNGQIKDVEGATGGTITGLANKDWGDDYEFVSGRAATEDQLSKVLKTAKNRAEVTVNSNEQATQNPDGSFNNITTGNILMEKSLSTEGAPIYNVHLNDNIILGSTADSNINLDGSKGKGTFAKINIGKHENVRQVVMHAGVPEFDMTAGDYKYIKGDSNIISGLDNKDFIPGFTGNTEPKHDRSGFAATEGQLKDLWLKGFSLRAELPDPDSVVMGNPNKIISRPIGGRINISGDEFGNHNITTIANQHNNEVLIRMNDNPNFQSVTLHDFKKDEDGHILHDYRLDERGQKIPVQKHEVVNGKWTPVVDEHGNPVYEKEADGSIKYERDQSKPLYKEDRVSKFDTNGVRIKTYKIDASGEKTSGKLTSYSSDGLVIQKAKIENGKVVFDPKGNPVYDDDIKNKIVLNENGLSNGSQKITNLAEGKADTDAVNVGQLKNTTFGVKADDYVATNDNIATRKANEVLDILGDDSIHTTIEGTDKGIAKLRISLKDKISVGKTGTDGSISVKGNNDKDGVQILANGRDGATGANGHIVINHLGEIKPDGKPVDGAAGKDATADISIKNTTDGILGSNGNNGMTRIVYEDKNGTGHEVATLDDGLKFHGDDGKDVARKLGETLNILGGMSPTSPDSQGNKLSVKDQVTLGNIGVYKDTEEGTLKIGLAKNINLGKDGSVTIGNSVMKDKNIVLAGKDKTVTITNEFIDAPAYKVGTETYISGTGLNANSKKITGVKAGENPTDAVNKGQLDKVQAIAKQHTTVKAKDGSKNITVADKLVNGAKEYTISIADNGTITANGTGDNLVTGKTVYDEVHIGTDGTYVKGNQTVAGNLTALDTQVKTNTDAISSATFGVNVGGTETATRKNNDTLEVKGDTNITTSIDGTDPTTAALKISLNEDLNLGKDGSVTAGTMTVGDTNKITLADNSIKFANGGTEISKDSIKSDSFKVGTETYISSTGLNANSKKITGVKAGENDTDAVNMKQLNDKIANTASAQEIAYTANEATPIKKVKLSDGFNFTNGGMVDAIVEDNGVVKFDINATTKTKINKIETIEGVANTNKNNIETLTPKVAANETAITNLKPRVKKNEDEITGLKDLTNITATGKGVIKTQAKKAINIVGDGKLASVSKTEVDGVDTYTVAVKSDGTKADKTLENIEAAGKTVIRTQAKKAVKVGDGINTTVDSETDTDGNITYKINVSGDGTVAAGNTGLISGGKLYEEVHVEHGNYIKAANTVAGNLTALDKQMAVNVGDIATNKGNITANTTAINKIGTVKVAGTAGLTIEGNTEIKNGDVTIKLDKSTLVNDVTDTFLKIDGSNIGDDNAKNTFGSAVGVGTITSDTSTKLVQEKAVKSAIDSITTTIGNQKISYKSNDDKNTAKEVALSTGFNFKNGNMTTATVGQDGEVIFDINSDTKAKIGNIAKNTESIKTNADQIKINSLAIEAVDDKKVEKTDFTDYQTKVTNKFTTKLDKNGINIGDKNDKNVFGNNIGVGTLDDSTSLVQSKAVKSAIDNINTAIGDQEISYRANNGTNESVKLSDGLVFTDGTNTTATIDKGGVVKFNVNENLTGISSIDNGNGGAKITLGSADKNINLNGGQLKGLANGTDKSDAVTVSQLDELKGIVANEDISYKANNGTAKTVALSKGLDFTNGKNTTSEIDDDGVVKFNVNKDLVDMDSITFTGGTKIDGTGLSIQNGPSITTAGIDAGNKAITNVAAGVNDTDAVNMGQLNKKADKDYVTNNYYDKASIKNYVNNVISGGGSGGTTVIVNDLAYTANGGTKKTVSLTDGLDFQNGSYTDAKVEDNGKVTIDVNESKLENKIENVIDKHTVVNLGDANIEEGNNITITRDEDNKTMTISTNADMGNVDSVGNGNSKFTFSKADVVTGKPASISANNSKLTGIEAGEISEDSTDAVTGAQLYNAYEGISNVAEGVNQNAQNINKVDTRVRHVGALSAALAGLHPMQYDPLHPSQVLAAMGTYRDKQAVAVGATHYFNENVMLTAGLSMGTESHNPELMANVGIAWKLGKDEEREKLELPARYDGKQMASIYMMQTEMDRALYQNQKQLEKNEEQARELEKEREKNKTQELRIQKQEQETRELKARLEKLEEMLLRGDGKN